jgi:hypothetical protein
MPRHRASVIVRGNSLEIHADNSSLNAILKDIAAKTGLHIVGGLADQRVFGTYGPAPAERIISQLLDGTGTNMILSLFPDGRLDQLVLSSRNGGPTPPSPSSIAMEDDPPIDAQATPATPAAVPQPQQAPPQSQVPPLPFSQPAQQPAATDPMRTPVTPDPGGIVSAPTVAPATEPGTTPGPATQSTGTSASGDASATPQSPNGVKTPQQIYDQLQKLLQQQQKQPGSQ